MTTPINGLGSLVPPPLVDPLSGGGAIGAGETTATDGGFGKMFVEALERSVAHQATAEANVGEHLAGGEVGMIDTVTGMKEADLSLRLMIQIRNKLLAAYDEIKQIRI